eukprot:10523323-Lingulodinium_polyedra.AAC.1
MGCPELPLRLDCFASRLPNAEHIGQTGAVGQAWAGCEVDAELGGQESTSTLAALLQAGKAIEHND